MVANLVERVPHVVLHVASSQMLPKHQGTNIKTKIVTNRILISARHCSNAPS